jgi:hypothetical protein
MGRSCIHPISKFHNKKFLLKQSANQSGYRRIRSGSLRGMDPCGYGTPEARLSGQNWNLVQGPERIPLSLHDRTPADPLCGLQTVRVGQSPFRSGTREARLDRGEAGLRSGTEPKVSEAGLPLSSSVRFCSGSRPAGPVWTGVDHDPATEGRGVLFQPGFGQASQRLSSSGPVLYLLLASICD